MNGAGSGLDEPVPQRLFVGVEVPPAVRRRLAPIQAALVAAAPELRPTRPEGWHLTLAFLGTVEAARVDEVVEVVGSAVGAGGAGQDPGGAGQDPVGAGQDPGGAGQDRGGAVGLSLGTPGRFGSGVVWVGVDDDPPGRLAELGAAIQDGLAARGLPVTRQPVRPHVTLARGGRGRPVRAHHLEVVEEALTVVADGAGRGLEGAGAAADRGSSWVVDEVQLWRSHLGRGPARYEVVAAVPLTS